MKAFKYNYLLSISARDSGAKSLKGFRPPPWPKLWPCRRIEQSSEDRVKRQLEEQASFPSRFEEASRSLCTIHEGVVEA